MAATVARSASALRRAAWTVGAIALALATGAWLLYQPAPTPLPPQPLLSPSSTPSQAALPRPALEAKPDAITRPASAPASAALPLASTAPAPSASDDLQKVMLALQDDATPAQARSASDMLARCAYADHETTFVYHVRDQGGPLRQTLEKSPGFNMDQWIRDAQDRQRRCQVFDAATLARRGELLKRAYEGALPGMALEYLLWLNANPNQRVAPDLIAQLQREVRQTAEEGDFETLLFYSHSFGALGGTEVERQAYKEALFRIQTETFGQVPAQESRDSLQNLENMRRQSGWTPPTLSADERREADALAKRVVDEWRKRH